MADMTVPSAFKYGFLRRCIEEGCDDAEVGRRAEAGLAAMVKAGMDPLAAARTVAVSGLALPVVGAAGLGALGGYGLAKLREPDVDPEEIRQRELIEAYDMHTQQARLRALARKLRPPERPSFVRL